MRSIAEFGALADCVGAVTRRQLGMRAALDDAARLP